VVSERRFDKGNHVADNIAQVTKVALGLFRPT